ncbi:hypothetical protein [Pseudomonas sp. ES1]|uniref:hypothetical protein n=1 Tax=Pseudomonas sp. ES1 TaxID=3424775 RepID=UPI003D32F2E0
MLKAHAIPNRVIFGTLLLTLLVSLRYFCTEGLDNAWVQLNENQIMYLYSTSAQVIAAIYGLTIAGYIFLRSEFIREAKDDPTLAEPIEKLENRYFQQLSFITALAMTTICVASLVIAYETDKDIQRLTILMNSAQCLFGISFLAIFFFIVDIVQPGNIKSASKKIQKKIDPFREGQQGNFNKFIENYSRIENALSQCIDLSYKTTKQGRHQQDKRTPNSQILESLARKKIIDQELTKKIKTLISLRHAIMHGGEEMVSKAMVDQAIAASAKLELAVNTARGQ